MKKRLFALALLLTGLVSCNSDEEAVKVNTDYVEPGTAVIATNFYSVKTPLTKADPTRTAAFEDEKEINSIAFFVQVADDETLQLFQSTKTVGTVDGLLEALKETTAGTKGSYTAKFKMKMNGNNEVHMFALANYAENNVDLTAITTATALKTAVSKAITDKKNPEKPLLMLGSYTKTLNEGQAYEAEFKMDRLVARVDIVNEAYNADETKGFRLKSAQVLNGKEQSSLLPDQATVTDAIAVLDEMGVKDKVVEVTAEGSVDVVAQRLDTLYMYENSNKVSLTTTAIQINGTFNGTPVAQRVEFMKEDPATGVKTQLPIGRNTLYTIKILPSQDSTSVSFTINVEDWTNAVGDTLTIEPKREKPVLSALTETSLTAATITGKRIDIDAADNLSGTITFTAEGNQDTKVEVQYIGRKGASWMGVGTTITQGELQGYTKASSILKREYTIDFSEAKKELEKSENKYLPSDAFILVQNANAATICDTIRVCFRPDYEGIAGAKPVLMKTIDGKEVFWAPVNVGATKIATSIPVATDQAAIDKLTSNQLNSLFEQGGYYYQWGRKKGFKMCNSTVIKNDTANVSVIGWPDNTNYLNVDAEGSPWKDKFIKGSTSTVVNWLLFVEGQNNPTNNTEDILDDAWYQRLWDANSIAGNRQTTPSKTPADPCPDGWRVPTIAEWEAIGAGNSSVINEWDNTNKILKIPGVNGDKLILPAAGSRHYSSGLYNAVGGSTYYWSSSVQYRHNDASCVIFNSATLTSRGYARASGYMVRCIQE